MNSKWYWLIRQKYRNLKFQIKKAAFRLNERKESSERLSSFSRIVIRTLLVQVAINLVLVAVLYVGDKLLLSAMEIFAKTQTDPLIAALSESMKSICCSFRPLNICLFCKYFCLLVSSLNVRIGNRCAFIFK